MSLPADWSQPVTLPGRFLRLEPLTVAHAPGIARHATAETLSFLVRGGPQANTPDGWAAFIERLNAIPHRLNWAVVMAGGEVAGRISYSELRPQDRWLEIGTMLTPPFQGTAANPEAKLLLMERAFTVLGANRVQFKVDARNLRSQRAMEKLGAVREGLLRQYQLRPDGVPRDSVMFSVLAGEWPRVREGLLARLEAVAPGVR